ncbi:Asp23/Gls24 family envelope stress response protein [Corynebacterium comes]|uniref:Alkaline shock response membrane anchor protein AmaP n=1 Tax=Corynebacterium comes TaxID=2675218 RepID=A0A6B8VYE9_9CORY|nr:hypothetical protein [Corynebacterium comes]QGU03726.1 hypothetical protein CETAM_02230 [Corynebacterium comes]
MNNRIALFDRTVVLITGLLALAGGAWVIGLFLNVPFAQNLADLIDFPAWRAAPEQVWFDLALVGILLVSAVIGGFLIALNLRRYRINRVVSPTSDDRGTIELDLATLADAIAREVEELPRVDAVHANVADSWDRPTMTLTVRARADADVPALRSALSRTERQFRAATPGIDVDTIFKLHLFPVER